MSRRKTIAIDIDDVLADSTESLRLLVNERTGARLTTEHYRVSGVYRGYYDNIWRMHGLEGLVDFPSLNEEMVYDQSHVHTMPQAKLGIQELAKKYRLVLVTARDPSWSQATTKWLKDHFGYSLCDVHFAGHSRTGSQKSKGELCREVGASYLIDDNVEHCQTARELGVETVLFGDYGWHQGIPSDQIICKDWQAVMEFFDVRAGA